VAAFDPDIAREASEPVRAETAPEREPEKEDDSAQNDEQFSEFLHRADNVAAPAVNGN
jgi:hypothetical protein